MVVLIAKTRGIMMKKHNSMAAMITTKMIVIVMVMMMLMLTMLMRMMVMMMLRMMMGMVEVMVAVLMAMLIAIKVLKVAMFLILLVKMLKLTASTSSYGSRLLALWFVTCHLSIPHPLYVGSLTIPATSNNDHNENRA